MLLYHYLTLPRFTPESHFFRLIDLLPSSDKDEPLQVNIREVRLEDEPVYECLSYVWGTPSPSSFHHTVSVVSAPESSDEAESTKGKIRISENLHAALQTLRLPSQTRTLWADAICINQPDTDERNSQVALMGVIYYSATRVNIYLGPDPSNSAKLAFQTMSPISHMHWGHHIPGIRWGAFDSDGQPSMNLPDQDERWRAISEFYSLEWFTRAWVQQEIGLSKDAYFYWGDYHMTENPPESRDIFGFDIWLEHSPRGGSLRERYISHVEGVRGSRNVWLQYGQVTRPGWLPDEEAVRRHLEHNHFLVVLLDAKACTARDARDCIYAFLGHPSARVARRKTQGGAERAEMFGGVGYREMMLSTIDGITPDESGNGAACELIVQADYNKSVQEVYTELAKRLLDHHRNLRMLSAVCHTEESIKLQDGHASWVPRWDMIKGQQAIGCSGWGWPTEISSPFTSGDSEYVNTVDDENRLQVLGVVIATVTEVLDWTEDRLKETKDKLLKRERSIALHTGLVNRRRVFRTRDGQEGLAQDTVREGDSVALLVGAYTPCVLRRRPESLKQEFVFVGNSVVFGIHDRRYNDLVKEAAQIGMVKDMKLV
ncbi:Heterokaryon incompatibility protein (HET) domain containing protein [Rhypophila decipiens]